jgi:hypothetical protein
MIGNFIEPIFKLPLINALNLSCQVNFCVLTRINRFSIKKKSVVFIKKLPPQAWFYNLFS